MKCICGLNMAEIGRGAYLVSYWCGGCKRNHFTCLCGGSVAATAQSGYMELRCFSCGQETNLYGNNAQVKLPFGGHRVN